MPEGREGIAKETRGTLDGRVLRDHIAIARCEIPERRLGTDDRLRDAMAPYLDGAAPGLSHFNAVVNGKRRLSLSLLSALHRAFGLDRLGLDEEIWLSEARSAFAPAVRAARRRFLDPLAWLRRLAAGPAGQGLALEVEGGLLGIGVDHPHGSAVPLALGLGQSVRLSAELPFEGWLTLFNVSADETYQQPSIHWIDPPLANVDRRRPAGRCVLPGENRSVPIGRPLGCNTLFAILWRDRPRLPWPTTRADALEITMEQLRGTFLSIEASRAKEGGQELSVDLERVRVAWVDYIVVAP